MQTDLFTIALGFLEGLGLIISPCILPILPIMLAGSLDGSKKRPYGIIIGFIFLFAVFTYFSRALVQASGIDSNVIRHLSYGILLLLGVIMISSYLTEKFSRLTQRLGNTGSRLADANNPQGGFWSGMLFGGLIAIIWTPCAGPLLAAVIVQTVIQQTNLMSFLTLLAFGGGAAVPMFLFALFGRGLMEKFSFFKTHSSVLRKILGAIVIVSVGYMIFLEGGVSAAPSSGNDNSNFSLQNGLAAPYPAPQIAGIESWINSAPLTLNDLKGKVVLIDFWAYSCINCKRTLPYLTEWYRKYHDKGLEIIGIHAPEFDFEKNLDNVKYAVSQDGIKYPVALDNQFVTWRNFHNQYWPAHFLIDKSGNVVYTHFGEGEYDVSENNIRYLLGLKDASAAAASSQGESVLDQTPETYLGYARADQFYSPESVQRDRSTHYSFPTSLPQHAWALQGIWKILPDKIISTEINAALEIHFQAKHVYMVMGNATGQAIMVKLRLNGKDLTRQLVIDKHTLYEAVELSKPESGILEVTAAAPGLEVYTFTFGG